MKIPTSFWALSLCALSSVSFATTAQEKVYLTQILNQLEAVQPLILKAQQAEPPNERITFHYTQYVDAQGQKHNGLLEDVSAIKAGIQARLNQVAVEPRAVTPLRGDYLDTTPVSQGG